MAKDQRPSAEQLERKSLPVVLMCKSEAEKKSILEDGVIKGYAAVMGNVDDGGDVILPGAFARTLSSSQRKRMKVCWQHDWTKPIGRLENIKEIGRAELPASVLEFAPGASGALAFEGYITKASDGQDIRIKVSEGIVDEFSIGYTVPENGAGQDTRDGKPVRILLDIELWEVSLVTFGMNPGARMKSKAIENWEVFETNLPVAPLVQAFNPKSAKQVDIDKAILGDGAANWARYSRAHVAKEKDGQREAFKYQIARMYDESEPDNAVPAKGRLTVFYDAVMRAMREVLCMSKDAPDEIREEMHRVLKAYYERFGMPCPEYKQWVREEFNRFHEPKASGSGGPVTVLDVPLDLTVEQQDQIDEENEDTKEEIVSRISERIANLEIIVEQARKLYEDAVKATQESIPATVKTAMAEEAAVMVQAVTQMQDAVLKEVGRMVADIASLVQSRMTIENERGLLMVDMLRQIMGVIERQEQEGQAVRSKADQDVLGKAVAELSATIGAMTTTNNKRSR